MDAGLPLLVFAPIDAPRFGGPRPDGANPWRIRADRPVLIALEMNPAAGDWEAFEVVPIRFAGLTVAHIAVLAPAVVAMPLWARGADAIQMLHRLAELGYSGAVEVHVPRLPDTRMVMAELSQAAGEFQIRIVEHTGPS